MKLIRHHTKIVIAACLVAAMSAVSVTSADASLVGAYTADSAATEANAMYEPTDVRLGRLPAPGIVVALYVAAHIGAFALGVYDGLNATVVGSPAIASLNYSPTDFSQFDPVT